MSEYDELLRLWDSSPAAREAYRAAANQATKAATTGMLEGAAGTATGGLGSILSSVINPLSTIYSIYSIFKGLNDAKEAEREAARIKYETAAKEMKDQGFDIESVYAPSVFDTSQYDDIAGIPTSMTPAEMSAYAQRSAMDQYLANSFNPVDTVTDYGRDVVDTVAGILRDNDTLRE